MLRHRLESIFAGLMKCRHCDGTVTRVNKGKHVYLVCSAAHAKAGTHPYESVPYAEALEAFTRGIRTTLDSAPRGNDTTDIETKIERLQVEVDAGEDRVSELFEIRIADNSKKARDELQNAERELAAAQDALRKAVEQRDTLASTNVTMRLAAVEKAFTHEPLDTEAANKALRGAVRKMIMRPQDGTLDILWHHADAPQETVFVTSRFDWDANQIEDLRQEATVV